MFWKTMLAPVLIAAAVMLGGASVATASSAPGPGAEFRLASVEVSATATATGSATASATPTTTGDSDPTTICASAASNPSLGVLCPLWTAHALNERSEQILAALIAGIANGGTSTPTPRPTRTPRTIGAPGVSGTPQAGQGNGSDRREEARAKLVAECTTFMAGNPATTNPRARFCREVLRYASSTATPTASATPAGTPGAHGFFRPSRSEQHGPRSHAPDGTH